MSTMANKCLGLAKLKLSGRGNYLEDKETNRMVDLPHHSLSLNSTSIDSLNSGDLLIYTATLNDCKYRVHSACVPDNLRHIQGYLMTSDPNFKYCHLKSRNSSYRVFVPFSARKPNGDQWLGETARSNELHSVLAFRQPEIHGCNYVAWSIMQGDITPLNLMPEIPECYRPVEVEGVMKKLDRPTAVLRQSDHQQVEFVSNQCGVIYHIARDKVVSVTSPVCQNVIFPASLFESWMKPGRFVSFDGRRMDEGKLSKLMGSNPVDLGTVFPCLSLPNTTLTLTVSAVLNKTSLGKCAWAWNDHIGRIFVPWSCLDRFMSQSRPLPFTGVHLEVAYNGRHDEIPWLATSASLCGGEEEDYQVRMENAQLLKTEDHWRVQSVVDGPENPSIFLVKMDEHNRKMTAFAKVIDLNSGDIPAPNTLIRVTYYEQKRHQRHALRAVLVTTMEKCERLPKVHMVHNGSGVKVYPALFEEPTPRKEKEPEPRLFQVAPAPKKICWNLAKLGTPQSVATTDFPSISGEVPPPPPAPQEQPMPFTAPATFPILETFDLFPPGIPPPVARSTSMWSGTPVEARPEPNPFFAQQDNLVYVSSLPSLNVDLFGDGAISQPSSTSTFEVIGETRNTQSDVSSPNSIDNDLTFVQHESETNSWTSFEKIGFSTNENSAGFFQYGMPQLQMSIFEKMTLGYGETAQSSEQSSDIGLQGHLPCCETEQLLWDLWENPKFVAAFSASDPEMFNKVAEKRKKFTNVIRD